MDKKIIPIPQQILDVNSVRINELEGIIERVILVSTDYQIVANDRFLIVDTVCTLTMPDVN